MLKEKWSKQGKLAAGLILHFCMAISPAAIETIYSAINRPICLSDPSRLKIFDLYSFHFRKKNVIYSLLFFKKYNIYFKYDNNYFLNLSFTYKLASSIPHKKYLLIKWKKKSIRMDCKIIVHFNYVLILINVTINRANYLIFKISI